MFDEWRETSDPQSSERIGNNLAGPAGREQRRPAPIRPQPQLTSIRSAERPGPEWDE